MRLRSEANIVANRMIGVVGGMITDPVFEAEQMPDLEESLNASSLTYKPGDRGSNTYAATYRP